MELNQLSEDDRINIIIDINKLLSEKYNISDRGIKSFWIAFEIGANDIMEKRYIQTDTAYL